MIQWLQLVVMSRRASVSCCLNRYGCNGGEEAVLLPRRYLSFLRDRHELPTLLLPRNVIQVVPPAIIQSHAASDTCPASVSDVSVTCPSPCLRYGHSMTDSDIQTPTATPTSPRPAIAYRTRTNHFSRWTFRTPTNQFKCRVSRNVCRTFAGFSYTLLPTSNAHNNMIVEMDIVVWV